MEYTYRRVSARGFDETVDAVEREVDAHGFVTVHVHDISAALAAKGFPIQPLRIYEIEHSEQDADPDVLGLLMPCRLNVFVEGTDVVVAAIRPQVVSRMFPEAPIEHIAERVERRVAEIVDCVTG